MNLSNPIKYKLEHKLTGIWQSELVDIVCSIAYIHMNILERKLYFNINLSFELPVRKDLKTLDTSNLPN